MKLKNIIILFAILFSITNVSASENNDCSDLFYDEINLDGEKIYELSSCLFEKINGGETEGVNIPLNGNDNFENLDQCRISRNTSENFYNSGATVENSKRSECFKFDETNGETYSGNFSYFICSFEGCNLEDIIKNAGGEEKIKNYCPLLRDENEKFDEKMELLEKIILKNNNNFIKEKRIYRIYKKIGKLRAKYYYDQSILDMTDCINNTIEGEIPNIYQGIKNEEYNKLDLSYIYKFDSEIPPGNAIQKYCPSLYNPGSKFNLFMGNLETYKKSGELDKDSINIIYSKLGTLRAKYYYDDNILAITQCIDDYFIGEGLYYDILDNEYNDLELNYN